MSMFPKDLVPDIGSKADYLSEDYVLKLTSLEAGFLVGMAITARRDYPGTAKLRVWIKGRPDSVVLIDHLIEKLEAAHEQAMKDGAP